MQYKVNSRVDSKVYFSVFDGSNLETISYITVAEGADEHESIVEHIRETIAFNPTEPVTIKQ